MGEDPGRRSRRLIATIAVLALSALSPALAQNARDLRGELQAKDLARDDARLQAGRLRDEIARLNAQLGELNAVAGAGQQGARDKQARLDALNARQAALQQEMGQSQSQLAGLLAALELYRRDPPPALLVNPRSARDAVRAAILIRAIEPELKARAAVLKARADELQRLRRAILAASEDLLTSQSALAEDRAALEGAIRQKAALERQLDADATDYDRRAGVLAGQLRALRASPEPPAPSAGAGALALAAPAEGLLVRRFGQAPRGGGPASDGLAWRTAAGAQVRAPAGGLVEFSGPLKGWGGVLIVDLGGGYKLVMAGLDRIGAPVGRRLRPGQTVASMAQAASPELYLELRKNGAPIDPAPWMRAAAQSQLSAARR
jgi:septal ring factor EnvC (AmiA/AmiB activator)